MKRILTLLIILLSVAEISAQRDMSERRPIWFGVNMGGTWQTSDMKPVGGIGWGITVSRYSRISSPSPIYWGWRFRFLDGRNFGYNYHALKSIDNNPVLSPYYSNTDPDTGYVFSNYKNNFDEFAFELIIGSNTLRKHGVLLYGFGSAGLTNWKTKTDLYDPNGNAYNYGFISQTGDEDVVGQELKDMLDGEYETVANGSAVGGTWGFMPSAGFGIGYQWSNFSIAMEHRTTWARTDFLDGTAHSSGSPVTENNDIYHYDGLTLKWNFNSHSSSSNNPPPPPPPNPDHYTTNPPPSNPNPDPGPTTSPSPNPTPNPVPVVQPPTVTFTTPNVDPYTATVLNQNLVVRVTNVSSASQITLTINNQVSTNFSYNPGTNTMTFSHTLQPGNNVYKVVASNSAGSAQDVQTIIYKGQTDPTPSALPPQVTITNPPSDPYTSTVQTMTVTATVLNVPTAAGITITRNGSPVTVFTYNAATHQLTFTANLQTGNNLYQVVGTNSVGSASDAVTIIYGNANTAPPPVVTITSPNACPAQTKVQAQTITANITNVTAANQVSVTFNNQAVTNFSYLQHGAMGTISFTVNLVSGNNPFTITGTNSVGTDSKSCTITYKPQTPQVVPPDVNITVPAADPYSTNNPAFTLNATVLNVASSAEITVTANNAVILGWTYDMNTHVLAYSTNLQLGTTVYKVTATNANGTDNDAVSVIYKQATPVMLPPTVDIYNPTDNPHIVNTAAQTVNATVMNVTQSSQITVTLLPNIAVPFTFDAANHRVTFNVTLHAGANQYTVTATNTAGTASDAVTIKLVDQQNGSGADQPGDSHVIGRPGNTDPHGNPTSPNNPSDPGSSGTPPPPPPPPPGQSDPVVTNTSPSAESSTTTQQQLPCTFTVTGVSGASDISVRVNNMPVVAGVNYNATTHVLTFTANLNSGSNTISVRASNAVGITTKTITVTYNPGNRVQQQPKKSDPPKQEQKKEEPKKEEPKKEEPKPADPAPAPSPRGGAAPTGTQSRPR